MRKILTFLLALMFSLELSASAAEAQKRELRSAWIATVWRLDWPSTAGTSASVVATQKRNLTDMLDKLKAQNFNAVYLQVRTMCDAFYASSDEPGSSYLTGNRGSNPGWDPLAFAVEECHKRGMQLHAWVNPYRFSTGTNWNTPQDNALRNAGMLLAYTNSNGTTTILNPGLVSVRQHIVKVCREIVHNYDIDGLVFDDYFYPDGIPTTTAAADYNLWNDSGVDMTFADWRRNNVNLMVSEVYAMVQEEKPEVRFGISPAGVAGKSASHYGVSLCPRGSDWQYDGIFCDPLAWYNAGTVDYMSPQIYWKTNHSTNPFGPITQWWSTIANHFGRHHYASHSISFLTSSNNTSGWADVVQQIKYSRQYNMDKAPGVVLYSAKNINGDNGGVSGLGDYLLANVFQHKALVPALTWKNAQAHGAPQNLTLDEGVLEWTAEEGTLVKYAVYAVPETMTLQEAQSATFGGILSNYLLDVTYSPSFTLPSAYQSGYWYAVSVVDGYNIEYEAANTLRKLGDLNGDGKIDVLDVTAMINMILKIIPEDLTMADVNADGSVNVLDVTILINMILGIN
jgi:uncharacterized lipoprotein YddW (UPF0748 family)